MASSYSPWIYRTILYKIPYLFKVCPAGNYHWFWDRLCFCRMNESSFDSTGRWWHGGILDMKTGKEYQPCPQCLHGGVVQRTEHQIVDLDDGGSNPLAPAIMKGKHNEADYREAT